MATLKIPKLTGAVGGGKAKNAEADVKIVQELLNAAVAFGELTGFKAIPVDGKLSDAMLNMLQRYQKVKLLGAPKNAKDAIVEPDKSVLKALASNPYVDERWSVWDDTIKATVNLYNKKFEKSATYNKLDWRLIKAQVWTEVMGGPDLADWDLLPMQIGKFKQDQGFAVVSNGLDHSELVVDATTRDTIKKDHKKANNILAGVSYDVHLAAMYKYVEVIDDPTNKEHELGKETLTDVAKSLKTTVPILMRLNKLTEESARKLRPGVKLTYQLGHSEWQIVGWRAWNDALKAYNGGGDPNYMKKIELNYNRVTQKWQ